MNEVPEPASASPKNPSPTPHAAAVDSCSEVARPVGPSTPINGSGSEGMGSALVDPRSRRANASTPITRKTRMAAMTGTCEDQSNWPASGRWSVVHPNQDRLANGARSGMAAW
jgi:hypothetical protein